MYTFESRVRYSETDASGKLSLGGIIDYFQDCTTFHSEDVGKGIVCLREQHKVWMLTSWQIIIDRYPAFGERITIGTQPYDFKGMMGFRNFIIRNPQGAGMVKANSVWCLLDTVTGKPLRVTADDVACYGTGQRLEMDYANRKIAIPEAGKLEAPFTVRPHQIDTNHHVNNGQYVRMAEEYLPAGFRVGQMRAEYKKQAMLGDAVQPWVAEDAGRYVVVLYNEEKQPYAVVEFIQSRNGEGNQ